MYVLDTCSFIWYILDDPKLPDSIKKLVAGSDRVYLSFATLWEIAIKQTIGKLDTITMSVFALAKRCEDNGIVILPLKLAYLEKIKQLPLIHRDPFDRIIMATAIEEKYTLITCDSNIMKYDEVKCLWEKTKEEQ